MPSIVIPLPPQGPLISVYIGVSSAKQAELQRQNQPVPAWQAATLLIDTGASNTNICCHVMQTLGIQPTGSIAVHTPSTGTAPVGMPVYDVNIYIPMQSRLSSLAGLAPTPGSLHTISNLPIIEADFSGQQGMQGLLGRDVLQRASLSYHGHIGICSLSL